MKQAIYLDHAAATPVIPAVLRSMQPFWVHDFGNPSSISSLGVTARDVIDKARQQIADVLHAFPDEIIFTGSGTESTNLAIVGLMRHSPAGHIVTTSIEHHAVLEPIAQLETQGYTATRVPVEPNGIVDPLGVMAALRPETRLISVMLANNELGTIQPIVAIARLLRRENRGRVAQGLAPIFLHTDACQAASYLPLNVNDLGVDALTLNAAKLGGPKGIGVLYVRRKTPLVPLVIGGAQEAGRRAGTEAVPLIVGCATALYLAHLRIDAVARRVGRLRDRLQSRLTNQLPDIHWNGDQETRLPNNLNLTITGVEAEPLLLYLDHDGVIVGTGAACANKALEPSHVLRAIGLTDRKALSTIRLTLGTTTTKADVDRAATMIIDRVRWMRQHLGSPRAKPTIAQ